MKKNIKEQVIKYLLSIDREYPNNQIQVSVSRKGFADSMIAFLGEDELFNQLSILQTEGYITVKNRTGHKDLRYYIDVVLHEQLINYFTNKKIQSKKSRREFFNEIRAWITLLISICAFALSIYSLYLQYAQPK